MEISVRCWKSYKMSKECRIYTTLFYCYSDRSPDRILYRDRAAVLSRFSEPQFLFRTRSLYGSKLVTYRRKLAVYGFFNTLIIRQKKRALRRKGSLVSYQLLFERKCRLLYLASLNTEDSDSVCTCETSVAVAVSIYCTLC